MDVETDLENEVKEIAKPGFCKVLDGIVDFTGRWMSWLNLALMAAIIVLVILRYVFGKGNVVLEELQFHFYGVMLILAIGYTQVHDGHIRLDLFHTRFKPRTKEFVEIFGILFLLIPMVIVLLWHSILLVDESWRIKEMSDAPMGLCCRYIFKAFFPAGMVLLGIAAISRLARGFWNLKRYPKESE